MNPVPCHQIGTQPNRCATALYEWRVYGNGPLHGRWWAGWRIAGRELVSPDGQRISPERLRGLLFREASEARIAKAKMHDRTGEVIPARERFAGLA